MHPLLVVWPGVAGSSVLVVVGRMVGSAFVGRVVFVEGCSFVAGAGFVVVGCEAL